jgi:hypothetical protein
MSEDKKDCKESSCCEAKSPHEVFDKINEKPIFNQNIWAQSYLISAAQDIAFQLCKLNKKIDCLVEEVEEMSKSLCHIDKRLCGEEPRHEKEHHCCRD